MEALNWALISDRSEGKFAAITDPYTWKQVKARNFLLKF